MQPVDHLQSPVANLRAMPWFAADGLTGLPYHDHTLFAARENDLAAALSHSLVLYNAVEGETCSFAFGELENATGEMGRLTGLLNVAAVNTNRATFKEEHRRNNC